ncbi:amino acid adenylation domain-containing protein [Streptomyces rubiginosohelvolus]
MQSGQSTGQSGQSLGQRDGGAAPETFALTDMQEAYYVGQFADPASAARIYVEFETSDGDVARMEEAWNALVAETGMLRAEVVDDGRQTVRPAVPHHPLPVTDLRSVGERERTEQLAAMRARCSGARFDVHRWPLFAVEAALLPGGRTRVHLALDEMMVDGPSVSVLLDRWYALYRGGTAPAAPSFGFRDYLEALRVRENPERTRRALDYWRRKLQGLRLPPEPTGSQGSPAFPGAAPDRADGAHGPADADGPHVGRLSGTGERRRLTLRLPADRHQRLTSHAATLRVTPSALLLTLFGGLLHRNAADRSPRCTRDGGAECVAVVLTTYNRVPVHPDVPRVVGPFTSTSLFLAPEPVGPLRELLAGVRDQLWADLEHGSVGGVRALRELRRAGGGGPDAAGGCAHTASGGPTPLQPRYVFTSMLGTLTPGSTVSEWAAGAGTEAGRTRTPGVWLECLLHERDGELHVSFDYDETALGSAVAEDLFARLSKALETLAGLSEAEVAALDDVSDLFEGPGRCPGTRAGAPPTAVRELTGAGRDHGGTAHDISVGARPELPLTALQTAYLVGRATVPGGAGETRVHQEFRLTRPDLERLGAAWRRLVRHHPALRARVNENGTLTVIDAPRDPAEPSIPHHDLSAVGPAEAARAEADRRARLADTPLPLEDGPPWRLETSALPDGSVVLHVLMDALVADARAVALLFEQLFRLHGGEPPERVLTPPAVRYEDYLRARAAAGRTPEAGAARAAWANLLARAPLGPPPARRTPVPATRKSVHRRLELPRWRTLEAYAARLGVPLDVLLLTVYCDVWRRACPDATAFTVVVVSWDRPTEPPGAEGLVADFTRLGWLSVDDGLPEDFDSRVRATGRRLLEDLARSAYADGLAAARDRARACADGAPPFPVVFTRLPSTAPALGSDHVDLPHSQSRTSGVAVDQVPMFVGDTLVCQWDAQDGALPDGLLDSLFADYAHTLTELTDRHETDAPVGADRAAVAPALPGGQPPVRGPERDFAPHLTLSDRLERSLAAYSGRVALRTEDGDLTYAELGARSARLARYLRSVGVGVGDRVAVHLERSAELVTALLAVVRAGAAYVPLDPANPAARTRSLAEDCGARVVLTDPGCRSALDGLAARVVVLAPDDDARGVRAAFDAGPLVSGAGPEDPAYLIYTSGTTGRPKGCLNSHRGIANRLNWAQERFALGAGDRVAQKTPCGFDVSVWEFFWPLLAGASSVLARPDGHRSPAYLARWFREAGVTVAHFVPSMLTLFLGEPGASGAGALRLVLASGEALPAAAVEEFQRVLPGAELHNLYGPTEAAVDVTHWACPPGWTGTDVPLGAPIDNTVIHLLDGDLRPVPAGTPGEICIAGPAVGLGYHDRPDEEAARFVAPPGGATDGTRGAARWYRTGDLARVARDGTLRYLGREDDQFKVRGLRVEAGEIESALRAVDRVGDARVLPWPGPDGDMHVAAVCVPKAGARGAQDAPEPGVLSPAAIREELLRALPAHLVPSRLALTPALPLTANGKLDRKAAALLLDGSGADADEIDGSRSHDRAAVPPLPAGGPPVDLGEVSRIIAGHLDLDPAEVLPDADLFALGATSFTMIRVSRALERLAGVRIPLDALVSRPTPAGLTEALRAGAATCPDPATAPERGPGQAADQHPAPAGREAEEGSGTSADAVAAVAARLLGVASVGPDADLFALGATSFVMIRLARELRRLYAVEVPLDLLVNRPTARSLAEGCTAAGKAPSPPVDAGASGATVVSGAGTSRAAAEVTGDADVAIAFDPEAKAAFKAERRSLRRLETGLARLPLDLPGEEAPVLAPTASVRTFGTTPLTWRQLSRLLTAFTELGGGHGTRRPYPSAGGFYPVQVYVYVKPGRVEGLEPGVYYLDPAHSAPAGDSRADAPGLVLLSGGEPLDEQSQVRYNRPVFEGAAFGLFLVSTPRAIDPAYGKRLGLRYTTIEAGHMAQAAMERAAALDLGLCPVGDMDFASVRDSFRLDHGQDLLVSLWGGALPVAAERPDADAPPHEADHPSPAVRTAPGTPPSTAPPSCTEPSAGAVAVIGFTARLPGTGTADSVADLGQLLAEGRTAIGPPPPDRAHVPPPRTDRAGATVGGYLDRIGDYEPGESNVPQAQATAVDPQEHLLLATVRACLENAAVRPDRLTADGPVGVFTGAMWHDHGRRGGRDDTTAVPTATGLAHRISHAFDFHGPSLVVDAGCASGLAAIDAATRALRTGQCTTAVAAAANLILDRSHLEFLSDAGLLAESADSRPLTGTSDGWIPGEGVGAVLLKPLERALADGDPVHAVLRGGACRHAGSTRAYGMPSPEQQEATVRAALADAGLTAGDIGYVETSATGATLADALELDVVGRVFADRVRPMPVGSVKGVLGHMEAASAFGQLAKVIAQFRQDRLLPTPLEAAGAREPLPGGHGRVRVVGSVERWQQPPRVLLNSFAGTGAYASVVVEAPPVRDVRPQSPDARPAAQGGDVQTLPLSADSPEHLARYARSLADHLVRENPALPTVAASLRGGRRDRPVRAVAVTAPGNAVSALRELADRVAGEGSGVVVRATGDSAAPTTAANPEVPKGWLDGEDCPWPVPTGLRAALPPTPVSSRSVSGTVSAGTSVAEPGDDGAPAPAPRTGGVPALDLVTAITARESGLAADALGADSDLIALGVDSLRLVRIAHALTRAGGRTLSLTELYEVPVLGALAAAAFPEGAPPGVARQAPEPPSLTGLTDDRIDALDEPALDALLEQHAHRHPDHTAPRPCEET